MEVAFNHNQLHKAEFARWLNSHTYAHSFNKPSIRQFFHEDQRSIVQPGVSVASPLQFAASQGGVPQSSCGHGLKKGSLDSAKNGTKLQDSAHSAPS